MDIMLGTGASSCKDYEGLKELIYTAVECGIRSFDTAPSYQTEKLIGNILAEVERDFSIKREDFNIQTKIDPWQMQEGGSRVLNHIERALEKIGSGYFDALLIHWPVPVFFIETWDAFVEAGKRGLAKRIGVCNVRLRQIKKFCELQKKPDLIQIECNPLRTSAPEIEYCRAYGIAVQAYSPLCKMDTRIRDSEVIKRIADIHGKSVGQIVLRWHIDKGIMPVFTSTKPMRVREYTDIFDFKLSEEEMAAISSLNQDYKMYLESCICPGF